QDDFVFHHFRFTSAQFGPGSCPGPQGRGIRPGSAAAYRCCAARVGALRRTDRTRKLDVFRTIVWTRRTGAAPAHRGGASGGRAARPGGPAGGVLFRRGEGPAPPGGGRGPPTPPRSPWLAQRRGGAPTARASVL